MSAGRLTLTIEVRRRMVSTGQADTEQAGVLSPDFFIASCDQMRTRRAAHPAELEPVEAYGRTQREAVDRLLDILAQAGGIA